MKKSTCSDVGGGAGVTMVTCRGYQTSREASVFIPVNIKSILCI